MKNRRLIIYLLSVGRSDFDRYLPLIKALQSDKEINLKVIASSAHFSKKFGYTYLEFVKNSINYVKSKSKYIDDGKEESVGKNISNEINFITDLIKEKKPDFFIVLGDRYEMISAPIASLGFNIPIIHLYGGAVTLGAIDDLVRHSITKLSHIHFTATEQYSKRIRNMGEESWRIKTIGFYSKKFLINHKYASLSKLNKIFNLDFNLPTILVTFHPVTRETTSINYQLNNLINALQITKMQCVWTYPNSDTNHNFIIERIKKLKKESKFEIRIIENSGIENYLGLLRVCKLIIGNSSSGIVESSFFKLPSVNIGSRQSGKIFPKNVISVGYKNSDIKAGIQKALSKNFINKCKNIKNPYDYGFDEKKLVKAIKSIKISEKLLIKKPVISAYK